MFYCQVDCTKVLIAALTLSMEYEITLGKDSLAATLVYVFFFFHFDFDVYIQA